MDRKLNVLLVDDSRTVLTQLEGILGEIDDVAIVGFARGGAPAIRMTNESLPDLILMDIIMPGLDGLSALRTIKSMHPEIEVAMVTSLSGDAAKAAEAFRLGACQVLGKPLDRDLIESLIEQTRVRLANAPPREDPDEPDPDAVADAAAGTDTGTDTEADAATEVVPG